ncbi:MULTISPECIES: hypothetical protein [unclassified Acinetobacter]|uniref:hypothetical protein n=1 Tax=unclassified Acinetobacter TaxID=196816 RepID=UPI0035BB13E6
MSNLNRNPILQSRHRLTIEEFQEGVNLTIFGRQKMTAWLTPLLSVLIMGWGFYLGWNGQGKFFVILGASFLILQLLMRLVILPWIFRKQFQKNQARFTEIEQGIDLYQDEFVISMGDKQQAFSYDGVEGFRVGKLCYAIELKSRTMILVSKNAIEQTGKRELFEKAFLNRSK